MRDRIFSAEAKRRVAGLFLIVTGAVALAGCIPEGAETVRSGPIDTSTEETDRPVPLIFDALGATDSSIIQVYPGVDNSAESRQANGTFSDGDSVMAECKTAGRRVESNPDLGEELRASSDWVRIDGSPGVEQFATATYVENPDLLLSQLPEC